MPINIRPRNNGRSFEFRLTHKLLPKPCDRNFDAREEAQRFGDHAARSLAANIVAVPQAHAARVGRESKRTSPKANIFCCRLPL